MESRPGESPTMIPPVVAGSKIDYLDGLRCISVLVVVAGHLNTYYFKNKTADRLIGGGGLGVIFFFVISGFLITTLFLKEEVATGTINIRKFYIRRALRILPVAYLFILCMLLLNFVFHLQIPVSYFLTSAFFVSSMARLNSPDVHGNSSLVAHYWSLSVEEQYYLFFPWLFRYGRKYLLGLLLSGIFIITLCRSLTDHTYFFYHYESILTGAVAALVVFKRRLKYYSAKRTSLWLMLILAAIFFINYQGWKFSVVIISILFALLLLLLISSVNAPVVAGFLKSKITIRIGVLSYSIYIWQQLFATNSGIKQALPVLQNIPVAMVILATVSWVSYQFYEKKFLRLKSRFS